jgi:septum formation topological specificity factor MinE
MNEPRGRRIPIEKMATPAEVAAAVGSLSAVDTYRLKKFAQMRIFGLGRAAMGRDYKVLMQEAITSTLEGAEGGEQGRRWQKDRVAFTDHLFGAMRSISSHWLESYERQAGDKERLDCEIAVEDEDGRISTPVERAVDPSSDPFQALVAKEVLEVLDKHFEGDEDAQIVLMARKDGLTVPEMIAQLGLTQERANAALQRIRYFAKGII